jgi:hypothetical protein
MLMGRKATNKTKSKHITATQDTSTIKVGTHSITALIVSLSSMLPVPFVERLSFK